MAVGLLGSGLGACSAPAEQPRTAGEVPHTTPTTKPIASAIASAPAPDPHRRALGVAQDEALPVELAPMAGGTHVLAIVNDGERGAWARTIHADGALSKPRWFEAEHVVTALEGGDGRSTFVTSDGDRLCVTTFAKDEDAPAARRCETVKPEVVVPIGDRIALVYVDITETKTTKTRPATKSKASTTSTKKKTEKKGSAGSAAKPAPTSRGPAAPGASAASAKKPQKGAARPANKPAAKKKKGRASETITVPAPKAKVDLRLAWVGRDAAFETASAPIGVTFERPLAGMMIADAAPRGAAADLLFYEAVAKPKVRSKTPFGSARLGIASVDADGKLAAGSRGTLTEGDLEYGYITGQNAPRLVSSGAGTVLLTFAGRTGACQAERVFPTFGPTVLPKASCLVDPVGSALAGVVPQVATPAIDRIFAAEPRRAPGQVRADAPLVAWAGDRAVFVGASGFSTAMRTGDASAPVAATPPFVAKRARLAWSAFAPDGEGIAFAAGSVHRIDAKGSVTEIAGAAALEALGPRAAGVVRRAEGRPDDTQRAARIGDSFWLARGDVVRLSPAPMKVDALAGRAVADASALVGGPDRGLFLDVASGAMRVTFLGKDGAISAGPQAVTPVRVGFDAAPRAAGGAIVAGVSAADPAKVIALVVDANGKLGAPRPTSLTIAPGAFGVRLVALPGGGAWLMDRDRKRVLWLDDDGAERGAAALPREHVRASCLDGRPAPLSIPSVEPGKLVAVSELAQPGTCIAGDVAWTASGGMRWFGTSVRGVDSIAEVGALDAIAPVAAPSLTSAVVASAAPPATTALPSASTTTHPSGSTTTVTTAPALAPVARLPCPGDMVSIAARYCVDRFESTLVDGKTQRVLSPDFPATPNLLEIVLGDWATDRAHWGDAHARAFPLPEVPAWQRGAKTEPIAVPLFGARPNGYVTGLVAESACAAAGKRLCSLDEFTTACRGEDDTDFPYGTEYQDGVCNVFREDHPAAVLHRNASLGHLDPRLNRVRAKGRPLYEVAGARPACRSAWGDDAVYDLVGNLDEWVDEGGGAFAGGFYSRSTRAGCDAVITAHPKVYADYSTGVRCCKDAEK